MPVLSLTPTDDESGNKEFDVPQESREENTALMLSLQSVLASQPAEDRQLIYLRFFQNKTQSETAEILGTTQVQISRRERKILAQLRRDLSE